MLKIDWQFYGANIFSMTMHRHKSACEMFHSVLKKSFHVCLLFSFNYKWMKDEINLFNYVLYVLHNVLGLSCTLNTSKLLSLVKLKGALRRKCPHLSIWWCNPHPWEDLIKFGYKRYIKIKMVKQPSILLATYWNKNVTTLWKNQKPIINDHNLLNQKVATLNINIGYLHWTKKNGWMICFTLMEWTFVCIK